MGIGDVLGSVLMRYKADTGDHKRKLRSLSKEEQRRHKQLTADLEKQNAKIGKQGEGLAKITKAVVAVGAAYIVLKKSADAFLEDAQLKHAAAGLELNKLRDATKGLISDQKLLAFSASVMNSDFKITQQELQNVGRFMIDLRNQGNDLDKVLKGVSKSLVEGNVEALKKFGVVMKASAGTVEAHTMILERAAETTADLAGITGDDAVRATVDLDNALREIQLALGELAISFAPVIQGVADYINMVKRAVSLAKEALDIAIRLEKQTQAKKGILPWWASLIGGPFAEPFAERLAAGGGLARGVAGAPGVDVSLKRSQAQQVAALQARQRAATTQQERDQLQKQIDDIRAAVTSQLKGRIIFEAQQAKEQAALEESIKRAEDLKRKAARQARARGRARAPGRRRPAAGLPDIDITGLDVGDVSGLLPEFGPPPEAPFAEDFAQKFIENNRLAAESFAIFASAANQAFLAVITGSMSMADAFEGAIKQMIIAGAQQLFAESIKMGVFALVDLAFGNVKGAKDKAFSAAKAAAGAVALGLIASQMAGDESLPPRPGGAAGPLSSGAATGLAPPGGGRGEGTSRTFIIGGDFEFDSARQRRARLHRMMRRADQDLGGPGEVLFE